jgi:hypothetical protein
MITNFCEITKQNSQSNELTFSFVCARLIPLRATNRRSISIYT